MRDTVHPELRLQTHYKPVGQSPVFGDLMVMINSEGEAIHMAVFIADDIVFTKNGMTPLQLWTLMHIEDMMTYFPARTPSRIYFVRETERARSLTRESFDSPYKSIASFPHGTTPLLKNSPKFLLAHSARGKSSACLENEAGEF